MTSPEYPSNSVIRISEAMKSIGIAQIIFLPADRLVPQDSFHVHLLGGSIKEIGVGATVADALEDAQRKSARKAA